MNKDAQRKELRTRIKYLDAAYCQYADSLIYRQVIDLPEYQNASCIFCYVSTPKEINTRPLIEHALSSGKRVAVPKCHSKGVMELFEIHSYGDLSPGRYGILEPKSHAAPVGPGEIDLAIIPCLSCDRNKNRLGQGGGYYDRYLEHASFTTAALCREATLLDSVCCEPHDQSVHMVVTENNLYK